MGMLKNIVAIAMGLYLVAYLFPPAMEQLAGANFTGVDPSVVTICQIVLPLLAAVGIAFMFFGGE